MPSLRNILHKREEHSSPQSAPNAAPTRPSNPELKLIRSDTHTQEIIIPPSYANDTSPFLSSPTHQDEGCLSPQSPRRGFFSRSPRPTSASSQSPPRRERRLSNLLHLDHRSRSNSRDSSANIPADLPQIDNDQGASKQEREAQWEQRATALVQQNPQFAHSDLERSTHMFGQLADPDGANNPLSQVLYGLALRHGWGCPQDLARAVTYLSAAASNSAAVEAEALRAGVNKGGSAKGELVLAMFELANCFRNGWGLAKDPPAARQYYETAANLGDTDAMNEVAWCYLEGFGGKKDKFKAAQYYRLAETNGCPTLGNTWIWKDKYNPK
ncbi:hypothetical protein N7475_008282 [Penicillium sp. IBT 31633x]|nr:hypothetical protein N7475_008282 [Penicillium sp. IBT 31633x]